MLTIQMKKTSWMMIYNHERVEEYMKIRPLWEKRFQNLGLLKEDGQPADFAVADVRMTYGFSEKSPVLRVRISVGIRGDSYVLKILRVDRIR